MSILKKGALDTSNQEDAKDTSIIFNELIYSYKVQNKPIEVDFRKLVNWVPYSDSETHYIHKYPAKLLKHIPIFFLNANLTNKTATILDPFCGTGTVLLESIKKGYKSIGTDANPIARLIAKVKTTPLEVTELKNELSAIMSANRHLNNFKTPNVTNIDLWFLPHVKSDLSVLKKIIDSNTSTKNRDFFLVCFSNILKKVSIADPNLSVPVRLKPEKYKSKDLKEKASTRLEQIKLINVFQVYESQARENISRMQKLASINDLGIATVIGNDAKQLRYDYQENAPELKRESVDLIITSPPYAGAQKYVRASSFSLGWLGFCETSTLKSFENESIGREHYPTSLISKKISFGINEIDSRISEIYTTNPLRAYINGNYLREMDIAIKEMYRVLKAGKYCIIVIGNNEVCGKPFNTQLYINLLAERHGFSTEMKLVDNIHSRGLMTKRNKTASIINSEWILVLKK
ncbi:DNA methyltransferase [Shewanella chilikensis]|uniref:DNA methyltransferase n=1 Tax=Shewanella chilikensis TaxID=558541 RepID=UPI001CD74435|nr:DNA methyltransferase [Shewanella chilikensis]MCA0948671.1 site-specific DNA-methyltransferase [Shewanella chilikensis]